MGETECNGQSGGGKSTFLRDIVRGMRDRGTQKKGEKRAEEKETKGHPDSLKCKEGE